MIWLVAIICLLGGLGFGFYFTRRNYYEFWKRSSHKKIPEIEKALEEGLLQKRECYEEKVEAEHKALEEQIKLEHSAHLESLNQFYEGEAARLKEHFNESTNEISESYREKIKEQEATYKDQLVGLEHQFNEDKEALSLNFQKFSNEISGRKAALTEEIEAFEQKQAAIIERFKRDEEARKQRAFYHIEIDDMAAQDISKLKILATQLSRPEVLFKFLYDVYYKAAMEALFKRVLGDHKSSGGIYKITNINNEKVYIGRTVNFLDRWRLHAKRGCNIERISGLLYEEMFAEGLENFLFEIVEICPKNVQSDREKYWITFYKSDKWGYNIRKG